MGDDPIVVVQWTGEHANALKLALRMSTEAFADRLGASLRAVAQWSRDPDVVPTIVMQEALDTLLDQADAATQKRFELLVHGGATHDGAPESLVSAAVSDLTDWIDTHAGWEPGTAQRNLHDRLTQSTPHRAAQQAAKRTHVTRSTLARAIIQLYNPPPSGHHFYRVRCQRPPIITSILTRDEWTELLVPLGNGCDTLTTVPEGSTPPTQLDTKTATAAVQRLAESVQLQTRVFDAALYSLTGIGISNGAISGQVRLAQFAEYMLTLDLLETELVDAITDRNGSGDVSWTQTPLREHYLGLIQQVLNLQHRLCAGGPLALLAIARPASRRRDPDYAIVVQERSAHVLNAAKRLAVIPKAFHQPLSDYSDDAQLSVTLERELEEELLGREELQLAQGHGQRLNPLHRTRLSEPMRWLADCADPSIWRTECTGFGINLLTGNYEFASLITVEDEQWWTLFGGQLITNWEAGGIRIYSSLDNEGIASLANDERWSNEGIFAFLQGIRHLAHVGGQRVNLPSIELE